MFWHSSGYGKGNNYHLISSTRKGLVLNVFNNFSHAEWFQQLFTMLIWKKPLLIIFSSETFLLSSLNWEFSDSPVDQTWSKLVSKVVALGCGNHRFQLWKQTLLSQLRLCASEPPYYSDLTIVVALCIWLPFLRSIFFTLD